MIDQYHPHLLWIDDKKKVFTELLESWVNIHSGTDHQEGLSKMLRSLETSFKVLGGEMETISLPARKILTKKGRIIEEPLGQALLVAKRPEAPIQVLLGGHMDIALSKTQALKKCVIKNHQKMIGRGSVDMKAGLLILLTALTSLEESPFSDRIGWQVLITPDEEVGSPGSQPLWIKLSKEKKLALLFEPSFPDGHLVSGRKGSANYTLAIQGKAAHAGRSFQEGENAILSAARFALAAESMNDLESGLTINIGFILGGGPVNIVPDHAYLKFNVRCQTSQEMQIAQSKIKEIAQIENNRINLQTTLFQDSARPPKIFDKRTRLLFESLKQSAKHLNIPLDWRSSGGVCDGNILAGQGLATIDTMGGIGGNLHTEQEYVDLQSIIDRSKLAARFLMQIAAGEIQIP
jgi:glutamate carboxypeptidase